MAAERAAILSEETLEEGSKTERVNNLTLDGAAIDDLGTAIECPWSIQQVGLICKWSEKFV